MGYTILDDRNTFKRCIEIHAEKDGVLWQFSVMVLKLNKNRVNCGATNSTEWREGVRTQDDAHKFLFVIVRADATVDSEKIVFITPEDILRYTTIPSIIFNFIIDPITLSSQNFTNDIEQEGLKANQKNLKK